MRDYKASLKNYYESEINLKNYSQNGSLKIALGFPQTYSLGMASLGFQLVYDLFSQNSNTKAERFFLPDKNVSNIKSILTVETQTPINFFDLIGFSLSFELDYLNMLYILNSSQIPLLAKERNESDPIIMAGGATCLINPFAISDFIDVFFMGDLEEAVDEIVSAFNETSRIDILKGLSEIEGIYVPNVSEQSNVKKRICNDLDKYDAFAPIITLYGEFGETLLFETARGCNRGCYFCAAGQIQKPLRLRSPKIPKFKSYGIVGAAVFDNPNSLKLCKDFVNDGSKFSLSSLRLETLDEEKLEIMKNAGIKTVTIAPEAGTESLRQAIGKPCSNEKIFSTLNKVTESGIRKIKLYFMIGLPYETNDDIIDICGFLKKITMDFPKSYFSASIGCFVPKPCTPFAHMKINERKELSIKINIIKSEVKKIKNLEIHSESPRMAHVQYILSHANSNEGKSFLLNSLNEGYSYAIKNMQ